MIFEYSAGQLNHDVPFSRPSFDRVIYSVFCDVHECKLFIAWLQWLIQLPFSVENRTRETQTKLKAVNDISEEKRYIQSTSARPIDELTTKTDAFFWAFRFSDKYLVFLGFLVRVRQKNNSSVLGGFLLLVFFWHLILHLLEWVHRQLLPNIFVWEKCDEVYTIKTQEISTMRRLHCLEASTTRQSLCKQSFRRRKNVLQGYEWKFPGKRVPEGATRKPQLSAVDRQDLPI